MSFCTISYVNLSEKGKGREKIFRAIQAESQNNNK